MARVRIIWASLCIGLIAAGAPLLAVAPAAGTISGGYATTANGLGTVIQYWRLGEPAGATAFASEVPPPNGAAWELSSGAPVTSGVAGVGTAEFGGDKAVAITSRTGRTMMANLSLCDSCTSSVTVDLWVKPSALPPAPAAGQPPTDANIGVILDYSEIQTVFERHKGTALWVDHEGRVHGTIGLQSSFGAAEVMTTSSLSVGAWTHLQLTYLQTGPLQIAVDGTVEDATDAGAFELNWQDDNGPAGIDEDRFRLGQHANSGVYGDFNPGHTVGFEGSIDEVIIYGGSSVDDALTPDDMAASQGASGKPIGGIPMDDPRSLHSRNEALRN